MNLVKVPGTDVKYPNVCACCAGRSSTTIEIRKEDLASLAKAGLLAAAGSSGAGLHRQSRAVKVPHCDACSRHVRWKRSGGWLGVVLHVPVNAFLGLLLGMIVAILANAAGWVDTVDLLEPNWLIVGLFVAAGVALALATIRFRPLGPLGRNHARENIAAEIAGFNGQEIALRCYNDAFAQKLVEANPGAALARG